MRSGLDETSKKAIRKIMDSRNITFDDARLLYIKNEFQNNSIADDGMPLDPKTVTFSKK